MDILFIIGIVLLAITLVGHGIWVALAWMLRGGRSTSEFRREAEPTLADDRTAALRYLERLAIRNLLDKETYARLIRLMSEDAQEVCSLGTYLAMTRPAPSAKPAWTPPEYAGPSRWDSMLVEEPKAPREQEEPWAERPEPQPEKEQREELQLVELHAEEGPAATPPISPAHTLPVRRLVFEQPAEPVSRRQPRRPLGEVLAGFMAEKNIRWGELVGGLLIVGCSTALVISLWAQIEAIPILKFLLFTAVTAALFGSGLFVHHRWKLPSTGHALLLISTLLVPLNVLAFAAFSQPGTTSGVALGAEIASLVLFGWLAWQAGRVVMPPNPLSFAAGVIGLSATSLVVRFFAPTEGAFLTAVSLLPIGVYVAAVAASIWQRRSAQPIAETGARAVLLHLGVLSFATLVPLGLLIYQAQKAAGWLGGLSIPLCLMACAPLLVGAFLSERLPPRSGALRTAAISIFLLAECLVLGGVIAAWPMPARLLPAMLVNGAAMMGLALLTRRAFAHAAGIAWLTGAWLLGAHLALGRLAWSEVSGETILSVILSATSGKALIAAVVVCAASSEWLRRSGQQAAGRIYAVAAALLATASIALSTMFGFAVLGDPHQVTWVYLVYAAVGFIVAGRWKNVPAAGAGCVMLQMALAQMLVYVWPLTSLAWATSLLVGASLCGAASIVLRLTERAAEFEEAIVQPLASFAVLGSLGGVAAMCFTASGDTLAALSTRLFWVFALWASLAFANRWQALFAAAQLALPAAISAAAHSYLRGLTWYQGLDSPAVEPWVWQLHCAAAAFMGLMWALVRLAIRQQPHTSIADSPDPGKPGWREIASDLLHPALPAADRWISAAAGLGVIALALWGLAPAIAADHGWHQSMLPVVHHAHAAGIGSWVGLLLVAAVLVLYRREGIREATQGLIVLAAAAVALLACRWEQDQAATSAWRWMTAAAFAMGSIALWTKSRWAPVLRPIFGSGMRASASAEVLRPHLFILFALPAVLFSATFAMALGRDSRNVLSVGSDISWRVSLLGPPIIVALTVFAHGVHQRRSAYAVAAAFTTCAMITVGELTLLSRGGLAAGPAVLIWLIQLNAIALSVFALVWHGIRQADPSRPMPDYPRWPIQVVRAAMGAVLTLAAAALWLTPQAVPGIVAQAGTFWGILAVGLVEWSSFSTQVRGLDQRNGHPSAWPIFGAIIVACGLAPWDTGNWLCFHALMLGLPAAGVVQLLEGNRHLHGLLGAGWPESFGAALARSSGEAAFIDHDLSCGKCRYNLRGLDPAGKCPECSAPIRESLDMALERLTPRWRAWLGDFRRRTTIGVLACIAVATLFALRAALNDPRRPWWSAGALVLSAALAMGLAAWLPRRAIAYVAGLHALLAVSVWWLVQHWNGRGAAPEAALGDLVNVNVVGLSVSGLAWFWLERAVILRKLGEVSSQGVLPFHHAAAVMGAITVACLAGCSLYAAAVEHRMATTSWLSWAAWAACLAAMAACLVRPQLRHAPAGLYALGLAALLMVMTAMGASAQTLAWVMSLTVAGYVLLTTVVWRLWRRIDAESPRAESLRVWLPYANEVLAAASMVLAFYTSVTHPLLAVRLLVAAAAFICAVSAVLVAEGKERQLMQTAGMGLAALGGVLLAWSFVPPDVAQPWLHRAAALLAAASVVVGGLGMARVRAGAAFSTAIQNTTLGAFGAGGAALLYLSASEAAALMQRNAVPLTWAAVVAVIAALALLIACFVTFALRPARDPLGISAKWRGMYVYSAEVAAVLLALHVRSTMPWLFSGVITQYWPILVMGLAFAATAAGEVFERRGVGVLARPLGRTGVFLPALTAVDFFLAASRVHYSVILLTAGLFYAVLAALRRSTALGLVAALCVNGSLWYLLHHTPGLGLARHPQLWFIPPALAVLAAAHFSRRTLSKEARTSIHYGCLLVIYLSSTADVFLVGVAKAPWLPLVLGGLSVGGIFVGLGWRLRSFLQLGIGFLCLSLLTIIWHAAANLGWTWVWYVAGIALGVSIIAVFALFEKKRNEMNALLANFRQWAE